MSSYPTYEEWKLTILSIYIFKLCVLILPMRNGNGAGACQICDKCSYPHHSCCYPDKAIPSLESVGINVVELANSCKLNYHNGVNTVTYFAAIFYN